MPRAPVRQDRRRHRLGPGGSRRRPAADPGRPHGRRLRARGPHRRSPPVRHPRVQDGEAAHQPPYRADARGGHPLPHRRRDRPRPQATDLKKRYDAVVTAAGATTARDLAGPRPRTQGHLPGHGVPAPGQQGPGG
ncbi:hypothetical protein LV779_33470 [Streptomyces thinghirensis]|nr:hypothetical protein [Streptomyces thinghirensis]